MIYMRDYRRLPANSVPSLSPSRQGTQLDSLLGRNISVFTNSTAAFSGILTQTQPGVIKLLLSIPEQSPLTGRTPLRGRNNPPRTLSTVAVISRDHITAVVYREL